MSDPFVKVSLHQELLRQQGRSGIQIRQLFNHLLSDPELDLLIHKHYYLLNYHL